MSEQKNIQTLKSLSIDHDSPVPLHLQVEKILRDMINDPEYQNGKFLPKEVDLSKRLGISRNTIRQATNRLVQEKLLIRKKGVGTKVAKKQVETKLSNWVSFSQEMHAQGIDFRNYEIKVSQIKADTDISEQLEVKEGHELFKLERLRGLDNGPFVYFISYFHPRIGITGNEDFERHLYDILEHEYHTIPVLSREQISAILANKFLAVKLGVPVNSAILQRKRVVYDPGNRPIEYNIGFYRADQFTYSIDIKR
ncbi:GntR family transcriptional regulator [Allomuricauda sp. XS_ASV26]|uniref:GntR family transcriptional regulator n=1 Tax=Allomuricauda sp. XS_ASV26 TaxID=3241292 RepID=UPI0035135086